MRTLLLVTPIVVFTAVATSPASAADELHDVTYTVYADELSAAQIYYRDVEPDNVADYSHNPYQFSPTVEGIVGPGTPWVLSVRLADPRYWAMVVATAGQSPATPNLHCSVAVDGAVVVTNSGAKGALCSLRRW